PRTKFLTVPGCPASQLLLRHLTCGRVPTRSHEALPRRDATHLKHGGIWPPKRKTVAFPGIAVGGDAAYGNSVFLRYGRRLCPDLDALRKYPGLHVAPERDQKPPSPRWRSDACDPAACR